MTETFNNFWQTFPTISLFGASFTEKKEVNDLVNRARQTATVADEEARFAETARRESQNTGNNILHQKLRAIAVWHFEHAAQKYRETAELFARAQTLRVKPNVSEHFQRKALEATRRAVENETAAEAFN